MHTHTRAHTHTDTYINVRREREKERARKRAREHMYLMYCGYNILFPINVVTRGEEECFGNSNSVVVDAHSLWSVIFILR